MTAPFCIISEFSSILSQLTGENLSEERFFPSPFPKTFNQNPPIGSSDLIGGFSLEFLGREFEGDPFEKGSPSIGYDDIELKCDLLY